MVDIRQSLWRIEVAHCFGSVIDCHWPSDRGRQPGLQLYWTTITGGLLSAHPFFPFRGVCVLPLGNQRDDKKR